MPPNVTPTTPTESGRICESNSAMCSGTIPCGKCYQLVLQRVIPGAMRAGGFGNDKAQAGAFLKAYVEGWKKLLEEKVAEKKAGTPSSFVPPPQLLEFFAYREATRAREAIPIPAEPGSTDSEIKMNSPDGVGKAKKKGASLGRGDLKRMVEKQAKEPLANGTGTGVGRRDSSEEPAKRDEEKH